MLVKTTVAGSNYFPVPHMWAIHGCFSLGCETVNTVRANVFMILNALETFGLSGQGTLALPWVNYYKRSLVQLSEKIPVKAPKSVVKNIWLCCIVCNMILFLVPVRNGTIQL